MAIEDVTRNDLEQMFQNQADMFSDRFDVIDTRLEKMDDRFDVLEAKIDALDKRNDEDVRTLIKTVASLKKRVEILEREKATA